MVAEPSRPDLVSPIPLVLAAAAVFLDQATKLAVQRGIGLHEVIPVIPGFFQLVHVRNAGAAWGIFGNQTFMLTIISLVMLILILVFRTHIMEDRLSHRIAFGLLIGGIIGNLIDRIKDSYVTDFLDFFIGTAHWPAFNVADSCICVGVGIYIFTSFFVVENDVEKS